MRTVSLIMLSVFQIRVLILIMTVLRTTLIPILTTMEFPISVKLQKILTRTEFRIFLMMILTVTEYLTEKNVLQFHVPILTVTEFLILLMLIQMETDFWIIRKFSVLPSESTLEHRLILTVMDTAIWQRF